MAMLQWAHMGVRVPAGMCSAIWTRVSSSLGWAWGTGRAGTWPLGTLALPLPFMLKDGVIKPVCGLRPAGDGGVMEKLYWLWNRKNIIKVNQKSECLWHHKGCVCACVYFSFRCVSFLISTLFVYTPSGCHSSAPLPAQSWFNHISLCRTYSYNDDNKVYVHPAYA